ncbi:putative DctM (C4-dicarboxylate permease, large subunit) [uncultured Alphaproteobacteria bacterium]|uniref:TRAP transporter large permease protein n=1 Tax=uncultured Alphaproteobacteria bacterium TaxID=91750 RepID=A0A212JF99_9PROT|nr:putative DctM (C4-dicarboxylate permease, large subunit) [uncultured Alphaproteobacteria bacterium]
MEGAVLPGVVLLGFMFLLLACGVWVALALLGVGLIGMLLFTSSPAGPLLATAIWGSSNLWSLASLPMFIWMGEILFRSRLSDDMFEGLVPWMTRLPGRLLHVNIIGCGIFAAVSGSSAATAATIGKMSIPELKRRGYSERAILGSLAGSATLGLLIPPSIILIVYGIATDQSIARLFVAGVLPGVMLVAMFMGYVIIRALIRPQEIPPLAETYTWRDRLESLKRLGPVVCLIGGVIGSIYSGIASPTDAAAVGVFLALILASASGDLTRETFVDGLMSATRTSCMIAFILAGAAFLTMAMGFTGIPAGLARWIAAFELSPYALLAALTVFFIVMGCFLDGISVVVLTTSVIQPMIVAAGIDPIWFGVFIVLVVEMAQITPPVGFNLFVLQGLSSRDILYIAKSAVPFFLILCLAVAVITVFPEVVTYLPDHM